MRSANVVFQQDLSVKAPSIFPAVIEDTNAEQSQTALESLIPVFPSPRALSARVLHSKTIHLEQPRSFEIHISVGWNEISRGKLLVRAGTAGLRLHTANATSLDDELSITNNSQPGVIEFGEMTARSQLGLKIPYSIESDLKNIIIKLEISYTTSEGDFTFACSPKVSIVLPLGVNVQDIFRQEMLFSKFSIFTASSVPLRLLHCRLEGTADFEVHSPHLSSTELDVFTRQPVTLMARVFRKQAQHQDPAKINKRLLLQVQYTCLDEEVATAVEQAFTDALKNSDCHNLVFLLKPHLLAILRSRLSIQDFEVISLLREITVGTFSSYNWPSILTALPQPISEAALAWLSTWHTTHTTICLPTSIPASQIHHLTVPVEIPYLQILHTARLRPLTTQPNIILNQALGAELIISHSRRWGTDPAPGLPLSFVYELQAPPDTWLIGGQRKAHFSIKEDEVAKFALLLLPQRTGQLLLPSIDIRVVEDDDAGDGDHDGKRGLGTLSCETDYQSEAETVEVLTGLESTTVSLDGGGGGVAWVLETRERAGRR